MSTHVIGRALPADTNPEFPNSVRAKGRSLEIDVRTAEADLDGAFAAHQQSIRDHKATDLDRALAEKAANDAGLEVAPDLAASLDEEKSRRGETRLLLEKDVSLKASRVGVRRDLSNAASSYLDSVPKPVAVVEVDGTPDDGKSAKQTVQALREGIAGLRKEAIKTQKAPPPIDHAKATFAARVDELASTPPFEVVRTGHVFDLRFPVVEVLAEPVGGVPVAFDPRPDFVATHREEVLAAGFTAIEAHYEDRVSLALDANGKRARLAEIAAEIFALERRECAVIWAARKEGEFIDFRPDTDIRCVLGIDGPPPPRPR